MAEPCDLSALAPLLEALSAVFAQHLATTNALADQQRQAICAQTQLAALGVIQIAAAAAACRPLIVLTPEEAAATKSLLSLQQEVERLQHQVQAFARSANPEGEVACGTEGNEPPPVSVTGGD